MKLKYYSINEKEKYIDVGALELGFKTTLAQLLFGMLLMVIFFTVGFIVGLLVL